MNFSKTQTSVNKIGLFNSIQTIMNNSITYPEYNMISKLNTTNPVYQTSILTDSITFTDTYNTLPNSIISLQNNNILLNNNLKITNTYNNINDFHDDEVVNSKFLKNIIYNSDDNSVYINGNKAFYFK
jgi:hypothetical protein